MSADPFASCRPISTSTSSKETLMSDIDPRLAIAVAQAAGLNAEDLERQLRDRDAADADPDRPGARATELGASPSADDLAARQRAEGEQFVEELRGALNRGKTRLPGLLDA
jgi:hypothetical protein